MMKILITGAHFTPAVAVAEELKKNDRVQIVYLGRKSTQEGDNSPSAESKILPKLGIKFIPIITGRLQRSFTIYTIPSLLKIPIGFLQAFWIIIKEKPDVLLSFGGYVAVPSVICGWLLSIPIIVHEQTLISGLANKISSLFASKIAISFHNEKIFDKRVILTGNPIRREILQNVKLSDQMSKNKRMQILITGGNQGSHVINLAVEESLSQLTKIASIIHVTGENKFGDFERLEKKENGRYKVKKWIGEEWVAVLGSTDLVVSRAGINTLSELAYLGIPTLVIPLAYLYKDEQNINARYFENLGLVRILPQSKLSGSSLLATIKKMLKEIDSLKEKVRMAKIAVIPDAAKRIALETMLLAKGI